MTTQKSRSEPRFPVTLLARYRSPAAFEYVEERCIDLSAGGMFIESTAPAPVGTLLKLECDTSAGAGTLRGVARVVWLRERASDGQPMGMGVKFLKLEPGGRELVGQLLGERASLPPSESIPPRRRSSAAPQPVQAAPVSEVAAAAAGEQAKDASGEVTHATATAAAAVALLVDHRPQVHGVEPSAPSVEPSVSSPPQPATATQGRRMNDERRDFALKGDVPVEEMPRRRAVAYLIAIAAGVGVILLTPARNGAPPEAVKSQRLPLRAEPLPAAPAAAAPTPAAQAPTPAEPAPTSAAGAPTPAPAAPEDDAAEPATPTPAPSPTPEKPTASRAEASGVEPLAVGPKVAPKAKPAATPAPAEPATAQSPLEAAMACLATGDNPCVVQALEGKATSPRELELLIETHRAMGNRTKAEQLMQRYVDGFPGERRSATYRRQLERKAAESTPAPEGAQATGSGAASPAP